MLRISPWIVTLALLSGLGCRVVEADYDYDEDGWDDQDDCGPQDDTIYPGAYDPYGDDIDQNCDGMDGVDTDQDGFPKKDPDYLGDFEDWDCNDSDPDIYPGAPDLGDDGADSNCDGVDGVDGDGDGHASEASGGDDCDDNDVTVSPTAEDPYGDGEDTDCDGSDGVDADGDGYPSNVDPSEDYYDGRIGGKGALVKPRQV